MFPSCGPICWLSSLHFPCDMSPPCTPPQYYVWAHLITACIQVALPRIHCIPRRVSVSPVLQWGLQCQSQQKYSGLKILDARTVLLVLSPHLLETLSLPTLFFLPWPVQKSRECKIALSHFCLTERCTQFLRTCVVAPKLPSRRFYDIIAAVVPTTWWTK